ncbi:hypothetical protein [Bdellovibrio bacteriovorus]|uniref:Uncharacterized protein n=1 Tax=Bdellovibrio bacteriovorus str. Tiberius TaxID=1069642 RepID=K7Z9K9_BDEBC|nr:hypothetical protein [Bdellovibrio bacteriovorus]AFY01249.1 hypothetical protein Bdt_1554 [Bdellovibrio bacteriovorus str. Tiberius]
MLSFFKTRHNCYCAFCKSPRRIYRRKNISLMNILGSALASVVIMFALWQQYDPRVMVAFVVCLAISEVFVKIRWRLSVVCRVCGFDPVLYLKAPEQAANKVKEQLDIRRQDPKYLLAKPLNLPAIPADKAKALQDKGKGRLVSRSI